MLIVGCGCRGRELGARLAALGHVVRGTTRVPDALASIAAAGIEPVCADPDRLATLVPAFEHVAVVVLLLGRAGGPVERLEALHGARLEALLRAILDTTVRGVVYEASGSAPAAALAAGAALVEAACRHSHLSWALARPDPLDDSVTELLEAVERVLTGA